MPTTKSTTKSTTKAVANATPITYSVLVNKADPIRRANFEEQHQIVLVEIPRTYRVTFGPLVPGSRNNEPGEMVFRVYEGSKCRVLLRHSLGFWSDDVTLKDEHGNTIDPASFYVTKMPTPTKGKLTSRDENVVL